jgi:hypothetical protein
VEEKKLAKVLTELTQLADPLWVLVIHQNIKRNLVKLLVGKRKNDIQTLARSKNK